MKPRSSVVPSRLEVSINRDLTRKIAGGIIMLQLVGGSKYMSYYVHVFSIQLKWDDDLHWRQNIFPSKVNLQAMCPTFPKGVCAQNSLTKCGKVALFNQMGIQIAGDITAVYMYIIHFTRISNYPKWIPQLMDVQYHCWKSCNCWIYHFESIVDNCYSWIANLGNISSLYLSICLFVCLSIYLSICYISQKFKCHTDHRAPVLAVEPVECHEMLIQMAGWQACCKIMMFSWLKPPRLGGFPQNHVCWQDSIPVSLVIS